MTNQKLDPNRQWEADLEDRMGKTQPSSKELAETEQNLRGLVAELYRDEPNIDRLAKVLLRISECMTGDEHAVTLLGRKECLTLSAYISQLNRRASDEPPAAPYRVEPTRCNCHPETCCCPDYTIWKGDIPIARGSDERLLREFVLTENARASQPPAPAPRFQVGQEVFAGCAVRKVLAISHCYKLSNTICEGSGWTMFDEHSVEPCSGTTKGGGQ